MKFMKWAGRNAHWIVTALLALALLPAFSLAELPLRINWPRFLSMYWIHLAATSVAFATFLYLLGFPLKDTLLPLWRHYWGQKPRFVVLAVFAIAMVWEFGWAPGIIIVLGTVIFLEFFDRISGDPQKLWESATGVFIPAAYLFTGLVLVFCYNDLTASLRFVGSYDAAFNRLDAALFHGFTVSALSHAAARYFSLGFFKFLEFIYYGMFNQIGAALIIIPLCLGRKRALEFAGTVLTAYYLALVIFFVWPTIGPFSICPTHFADFPHSLATYGFQKVFVTKAQGFLTHQMPFRVDTDFYIAFPSMHIAQPLIVLWFLRRWKRITLFLLAYDVILVGAILLLEWHYFVDLIGGILIAALAIAVVEPKRLEVEPMNSEQPLCVGTYAEPLSVSPVSTTKWNKS
jgi:hypothetical protein